MSNYFQKIMIVDDDSVDRMILKKLLIQVELAEEIIEVETGYKALDILTATGKQHESFPELIFLDVNMPAMTGLEFLDVFIQLSRHYTSRCRIILVSSAENDTDRQKSLQYHCVAGYFLKPITMDLLLRLKENLRQLNVS